MALPLECAVSILYSMIALRIKYVIAAILNASALI
jgi:hypothetical protein